MAFRSIYGHGFARVAACTVDRDRRSRPQRRGDPGGGAARAARGVAVAVFPELGLTGYAIEDLLLQDALLDAVEAALARSSRRSARAAAGARRRRAAAPRAAGSTTARW